MNPNTYSGFITRKNALLTMERRDTDGKPLPFSITFVTADRRRNTGGEIVHLPRAVLSKNNRKITPFLKGQRKNPSPNILNQAQSRLPHHWRNKTRNVQAVGSQEIRKAHIILIIEINGYRVRP